VFAVAALWQKEEIELTKIQAVEVLLAEGSVSKLSTSTPVSPAFFSGSDLGPAA